MAIQSFSGLFLFCVCFSLAQAKKAIQIWFKEYCFYLKSRCSRMCEFCFVSLYNSHSLVFRDHFLSFLLLYA